MQFVFLFAGLQEMTRGSTEDDAFAGFAEADAGRVVSRVGLVELELEDDGGKSRSENWEARLTTEALKLGCLIQLSSACSSRFDFVIRSVRRRVCL